MNSHIVLLIEVKAKDPDMYLLQGTYVVTADVPSTHFLLLKLTMKFTAAATLALVASASAFAPAPSASVSNFCSFRVFSRSIDITEWVLSHGVAAVVS